MGLDNFKTEGGEVKDFHGNQHTADPKSEEEVKDMLVKLAEEKGKTPTMRDAIEDERLPSAGTLNKMCGGWNNLLEEVGLQTNQPSQYTSEDKEDIIEDLKSAYAEVQGELTVRKYIEVGDYSHNTVKKIFGSWKAATDKAGVIAGKKHGTSAMCKCGEVLDSFNEKVVGDILHKLGISHTPHKAIPDSNFISDFYIDDADLWIEVDGYENEDRPNSERYQDKLDHYDELELDFIEIKVPYRMNREEVKDQIQSTLKQ